MKHILCLLCCLLCATSCLLPASAREYSCPDAACFSADQSSLAGVCLTRLPEPDQGAVMLGSRRLRPGDVITAQQLRQVTFEAGSETDGSASISYLPVFSDGLSAEVTETFSFRGKGGHPPIAEDSAFETYKNLELTGNLRVQEPDGQTMQFTVTREPRRGTVAIREDGSFTYTPKKNKTGIDSFAFIASDTDGKESREATVTITILKPTDAKQYTDTVGTSCRFAAEWMKNTGIFVGESLDGNPCFSPDKAVTRGELLTMLVKTLALPTDSALTEAGYEDVPGWLKPYLAAAVRSGLLDNLPAQVTFSCSEPATAEDAASLLCAALNLGEHSPEAAECIAIANENGFALTAGTTLTRSDTAIALYHAAKLAENTFSADF